MKFPTGGFFTKRFSVREVGTFVPGWLIAGRLAAVVTTVSSWGAPRGEGRGRLFWLPL